MGFEVNYHYHERLEGDYNKEELKTFKKKVGDPFEDVPYEKLAGAIMAQFARRDIFIVNVEVFELSKKQVSFKETKGGIILKNKKFLFDGTETGCVTVENIPEAIPDIVSQVQPHMQPHMQQYTQPTNDNVEHPHNTNLRRPIDWVVFAPELHHMQEIKKKNLKLTFDKKYPVFAKKTKALGIGETYTLFDDVGREQNISDEYFVPGNIELLGDRELGFSENQQNRDGGKLVWGSSVIEDNMPDLRR